MFHHDEYQFSANTVLTSAQLQETSRYAARMLNLLHAGYSDGIVAGAQVSVEDDFLLVSPGVIRHQAMLYYMDEKERIRYAHTGRKTILKLRFLDVQEQESGLFYDTELILSEEERLFPYEMELGRFWSEPGAQLRMNDDGWKDMATAHNYVDIRNVPYAAIGVSTISPAITYAFAREMEGKGAQTPYDAAFCIHCLTKKPVDREVIYRYLAACGEKGTPELTNEQIYQGLLNVLNRHGAKTAQPCPQTRARKFIVE